MNSEESSSAPASATTSSSAPAKTSDLGEAEFLEQQAEQAKAAMQRAWGDFAAGLAQGVDPREWTRDYPWIAMSSAAAAGFLAAAALVPSKEEQALKKLAALERALQPPQPSVEPVSDNSRQRSLWAELFTGIAQAMGPGLAAAISAAVAAKTAHPDQSNGRETAPPANTSDSE